jgi:hypothetical protein
MRTRKLSESDVDRISIEAVFCLGGGELEDKPWVVGNHHYAFWYEGVPEYAESDFKDSGQYRTVILTNLGYGCNPDPEISDQDGVWEFKQEFVSSGEAGCPFEEDGEPTDVECEICEAPAGGEHGFVYLGESVELVYRLREDNSDQEE